MLVHRALACQIIGLEIESFHALRLVDDFGCLYDRQPPCASWFFVFSVLKPVDCPDYVIEALGSDPSATTVSAKPGPAPRDSSRVHGMCGR